MLRTSVIMYVSYVPPHTHTHTLTTAACCSRLLGMHSCMRVLYYYSRTRRVEPRLGLHAVAGRKEDAPVCVVCIVCGVGPPSEGTRALLA